MPEYNYMCKICGEKNISHKMSEKIKNCPDCGKEIKKLFSSNFGISFKGPGFYSTDSKRVDKYAN